MTHYFCVTFTLSRHTFTLLNKLGGNISQGPRTPKSISTSAVRGFCPGYFSHFVSGLEPRHIGVRPKGTPFGLGCYPKP